MNIHKFCLGIFLLFIFSSCHENKAKLEYVTEDDLTEEDVQDESSEENSSTYEPDYSENSSSDYQESNLVAIPFTTQGGVKYVPVVINGVIGVNMIIDTGCSGAMISISEVNYLIEKGALEEDDVLGVNHSMIADGSVVENAVIRLKKIVIGGKLEANNVEATVSSNLQAPLLLGNDVLDRVRAMSIDNENSQIIFSLY